jgi:hypothetical protein
MYKPLYATNVGARFILHFLQYMFRLLLVAIFRLFVIQKISKAFTVYIYGNCLRNFLIATNRGRNTYCKKCTIKRAPTFVAYRGFYIYWLIHAQQDA